MARNLVRFNPFAELDELQKDFFEDGMFRSLRASMPSTDIYTEDDKSLTVEAHLPNFDENDISVDIDHGALVIQAERHEREEDKKKKYVVRESASSFYRRIMLPEQADEKSISAQFDDGVLKVKVGFGELPTPKKIAITAGSNKKK